MTVSIIHYPRSYWNLQFRGRLPEIQTLSRVCPYIKVVQTLAKAIFLIKKPKIWTGHSFYKSNLCPEFVLSEKFQFFRLFGQELVKLWILMSNLCPCSLEINRGLTEIGPGLDSNWTDFVHDLLLDRDRTEPGQRADKDWILCPDLVWPSIGW